MTPSTQTPSASRMGRAGPLTVGDVFCGAGGFSEGFSQAGFRIAWGIDNWKPAVETFRRNHPGAIALEADVLTLDLADIQPVDVLVGSPPCVHFSLANKGGGGDREKGMELVRRYLEIVDQLKPKYWVMENVPAIASDLEAEMAGDGFPLSSGTLQIPVRVVLDSAHFGTPQVRRRLFSGDFPLPSSGVAETSESLMTLEHVIHAFPSPNSTNRAPAKRVEDPVYSHIEVPLPRLSDHFEDPRWELTRDELERSRFWKENNPVYGRMAFPDRLNRPSRTITATRTRGSRSTIVIPFLSSTGPSMRTLTLRECASVQGFPITYQFWGSSISDKDFLVGNAVAPPVARAIAHEILKRESRGVPPSPIVRVPSELSPVVPIRRNGPRKFSIRRRFRGIVPIDARHDHRVELDNGLDERVRGMLAKLPTDAMPPVRWQCRLYLGYATLYKAYDVRLADALRLARALTSGTEPTIDERRANSLLLSTVRATVNGFPDSMTLQSEWAGFQPSRNGPLWILSSVAREVGKAFPASEWSGRFVSGEVSQPILSMCRVPSKGKEAPDSQPVPISVRLCLATVCLSLMCVALNDGPEQLSALLSALTTRQGIHASKIDRLISEASTRAGQSRQRQTSFVIRA